MSLDSLLNEVGTGWQQRCHGAGDILNSKHEIRIQFKFSKNKKLTFGCLGFLSIWFWICFGVRYSDFATHLFDSGYAGLGINIIFLHCSPVFFHELGV